MSDRLDRVRESIAGERRHWLVVENRPDDLAALLSERDALAAVAEAARAWRDKPYASNSDPEWIAVVDALAAYDRTVAKP